MKCAVVYTGVFLLINVAYEIMNLIFIWRNLHECLLYKVVYTLFMVPIFISGALYIFYFCGREGPRTRDLLPKSLILAIVGYALLLAWILVFFAGIHTSPIVYENDWDNEEWGTYAKKDKWDYILTHLNAPVQNIFFYALDYMVAADWVEVHRY